jgi:hypothetical protein
MWNSGLAMAAKMKQLHVERPDFEGKEIVDILAYIRREGGGVERVYALLRRDTQLYIRRLTACGTLRKGRSDRRAQPVKGIRLGDLLGVP